MKDYITSRNNIKVKNAALLKQKKNSLERKLLLMEGEKSLLMALEENLVVEVFSLKELDYLNDQIPLHIINQSILEKLSSSKNPEGVMFVSKFPSFKDKKEERIIYLDDVSDPGNLGTIIRSALAFNFDAIYLSANTVYPYNEKVLAATKGAIFKIKVAYKDFSSILEEGYQTYATTLSDKSHKLDDTNFKTPLCLIFGNEARGVKKEILDKSFEHVYIEINNIDSLNVAVAAAICMYKAKGA